MKIARVFPRRTRATPIDPLAYVGLPDMFVEADEVHVSVTFSWDLWEAERLAAEWKSIAPVKIGGPAVGMPGGEFEPGLYLRLGYVITSRGCPNRCWFCQVWRHEGDIHELCIRDGWNVLDDNLLACSEKHIRSVFAMLKRQKHKARFTGGLEAARMKLWIAEELRLLKPEIVYFAYDTPDDYEPLVSAVKTLKQVGFRMNHSLRCYVLGGYSGDTINDAERRLQQVIKLGLLPMFMLYRDETGKRTKEWRAFQRNWARPYLIACEKIKLRVQEGNYEA